MTVRYLWGLLVAAMDTQQPWPGKPRKPVGRIQGANWAEKLSRQPGRPATAWARRASGIESRICQQRILFVHLRSSIPACRSSGRQWHLCHSHLLARFL